MSFGIPGNSTASTPIITCPSKGEFSDNIATESDHHIISPTVTLRPHNTSPYKKPSFGASNRLTNASSVTHSSDELQRLQPSLSTEELNQEMENLAGLMKDLSAITANDFNC